MNSNNMTVDIPYGYCECGCGRKTNKSPQKTTKYEKGEYVKFIKGHYQKKFKPGNWKGEKASLESKHLWVSYYRGRPKKCEDCGTTTAKKFEWANISGEYKRDLHDYKRLCTPCHRKFDNYYGEFRSNSKLNNEKVIKIRELYKIGGIKQKELAKYFGVCNTTIAKIIRKEKWRHI